MWGAVEGYLVPGLLAESLRPLTAVLGPYASCDVGEFGAFRRHLRFVEAALGCANTALAPDGWLMIDQ